MTFEELSELIYDFTLTKLDVGYILTGEDYEKYKKKNKIQFEISDGYFRNDYCIKFNNMKENIIFEYENKVGYGKIKAFPVEAILYEIEGIYIDYFVVTNSILSSYEQKSKNINDNIYRYKEKISPENEKKLNTNKIDKKYLKLINSFKKKILKEKRLLTKEAIYRLYITEDG